jgi:hypothetical protein
VNPTLDGLALFGIAAQGLTLDADRARDLRATFGLHGLECLDGGARGRLTIISATHAGPGPAGLLLAQDALRSFNDGAEHTLTDTLGTPWPSVLLEYFSPRGRVRRDQAGNYYQAFICTLRHLR